MRKTSITKPRFMFLRVIVSPLIFITSLGMMTLFLGPLTFLLGILNIFGGLILGKLPERMDIIMTFSWIIYPVANTRSYILYCKFID